MRTILCLPFISLIEKISSDKKRQGGLLNKNAVNVATVPSKEINNNKFQHNTDHIKGLILLSGLEDNVLYYDESSYYKNGVPNINNMSLYRKIHYDICIDRFDF
jgi:hypothetical protein|tara:strand:+ start:171 stop:482 length:312 start_codon:yes stop_codon:yes gene_type:complete